MLMDLFAIPTLSIVQLVNNEFKCDILASEFHPLVVNMFVKALSQSGKYHNSDI
jgi:hypothetical protein